MTEDNKARARIGLFPHRLYIQPRQPGQCRDVPPDQIDEWLRAHCESWLRECTEGIAYNAAVAACCEELACSRDAAREAMARVFPREPDAKRGGRGKRSISNGDKT